MRQERADGTRAVPDRRADSDADPDPGPWAAGRRLGRDHVGMRVDHGDDRAFWFVSDNQV
jgi:hypothetical protein